MKILSTILLLLPLIVSAQQSMTDSTNVINPVNLSIIRFTTSYQATNYVDGDSLKFRSNSSKRVGLVSPLSLPVGSATQTALNLKSNIANPAFTGIVTTTGSLGYATGAGGSVTQATNKTTAVTLNKIAGRITMNGAALAAGAEVAFTLTNSTIAATDVIIVNVQSVGTAGSYLVGVGAVGSGSCSITVSNASAGSLSQAVVLNFAVIKSVIN